MIFWQGKELTRRNFLSGNGIGTKMNIEDVRALSPIDRLLYWVTERESIRVKKECGNSPPWTDDQILHTYRFCNVRRMDDRVSRWLYDNWYRPYYDHPNMLIACMLARYFNLPNTLAIIGFPEVWNPEEIKSKLASIKESGSTTFNAAYIIPSLGGSNKADTIIDKVIQPLIDNPSKLDRGSMKRCHEVLMTYNGLGSFLAGQVVADLRWALSGGWRDRMHWAPVGPGSIRGMNRLHGRATKYSLPQREFLAELRDLISVCQDRLPKEISSKLEAHDYQNICCEYFKYTKALLGEGRLKQKYKPMV